MAVLYGDHQRLALGRLYLLDLRVHGHDEEAQLLQRQRVLKQLHVLDRIVLQEHVAE